MSANLPEDFFHVRENGALVFRVDTKIRQGRIKMDQIAMVNTRKGEIKPTGDSVLTDADKTAIQNWLAERLETIAMRELDGYSPRGRLPQSHNSMGAIEGNRGAVGKRHRRTFDGHA